MNTVGPRRVAPKVKTEESEGAKKGIMYRVANGEIIPNEGQKRLRGFGDDYGAMGLTMQITDVTKPLLSVREMVKANQRVVFDSNGSYSENKATGRKQYFKDKQGSYVLEMWLHDTEEDDGTRSCACCAERVNGENNNVEKSNGGKSNAISQATDFVGQEAIEL